MMGDNPSSRSRKTWLSHALPVTVASNTIRTVIDDTAELYETVYVSGGRRGMDVGLAPGDLIHLLDAIVAPITA